MGKLDSSRTRVFPVFERLMKRDPSGASWLPKVLALPDRFDGTTSKVPEPGPLVDHAWHPQEKRLRPPKALLRWLIENPAATPPAGFGTKSESARVKRAELASRDKARVAEALGLLELSDSDRAWHIFEGPTSVDAYLETAGAAILIEGKRTERGPTTHTTWMPVRHQMLRNIDSVWDDRGNRAVGGFFIVEGEESNPAEVPPAWRQFARDTISPAALEGSLPHRSISEQAGIAAAFFGVTTWQALCHATGIPWGAIAAL